MTNNTTSALLLLIIRSPFGIIEVSVLTIVLTIVICVSLYGNGGLLYVLYCNDKMWTSYYLLIGNLATAGVLISLFSMPFSLGTIITGFWPFEENGICTAVAFLNSLLLLVTIFTHTMISVGKYFAVVKPFSRAMTVKRTKLLIIGIWLLAVLISIGPLFNFGRYSYGRTTLACGTGFPQNKTEMLYLLVLAFVGFVLPNIIMAYVYVNVFISVRQHSKRLGKSTSSTSTENVMSLHKKLILAALSSLICFLLCWSPFCIFVLMSIFVGSRDNLPHALGISAYWCGFAYNALNPFIIASMCSRFGEGLRDLTVTLSRIPLQLCSYLKEECASCCCKRCRFKKMLDVADATSLTSTTTAKAYAKYTIKETSGH